MKKVYTFLISIVLLFSFCSTSFALTDSTEMTTQRYIEYLEGGEYIVITIEEDYSSMFSTISKNGSKTFYYYNANDEVVWSAKLSGTFTYTGSSATCTASSITHSSNNSNWRIVSSNASKSGNTAIGEITAKSYFAGICVKTVEETITLSCSANGTLS